ncbi:hypothetical protein CXG81DRAFT_9988 [Caulochytrium protostelioides]|uniref:Cation efflux protein n=1 Tax=Caulochytrium protostelioides TaxID=1555241 RepID=A0A4P9XCC1_9FUNG|nr:cation efflux protein [Caulochytrium protostelioides]RKP03076.1 hypothetical protein CXG81DRAFT_9988 [Caulochytrium protostelioides]|eukprot:RKP03076.1 hypothetical protein CXG81DRAFT_9988 [Caulochytrium protostelioides]
MELRRLFSRYLDAFLMNPETRNVTYFLALNISFTFVEALYGYWTGSLGLTSDAVHMLFDSTALIGSLVASVIARWPATDAYTYGYGRVEVLAGFVNALILVLASAQLLWESVLRLSAPEPIGTDNLLLVAVLGLVVNIVGIFAFDHGGAHGHAHCHGEEDGHGHGHSMFLHILADTLGSVGVIISSLLVLWFEWHWADPLCSLFISALTIVSVWPLLRQSALTLLQRVPLKVQQQLPAALSQVLHVPGVVRYTEPRVWSLDSRQVVGTVHVQVRHGTEVSRTQRLVASFLRGAGVQDITVQIDELAPEAM